MKNTKYPPYEYMEEKPGLKNGWQIDSQSQYCCPEKLFLSWMQRSIFVNMTIYAGACLMKGANKQNNICIQNQGTMQDRCYQEHFIANEKMEQKTNECDDKKEPKHTILQSRKAWGLFICPGHSSIIMNAVKRVLKKYDYFTWECDNW